MDEQQETSNIKRSTIVYQHMRDPAILRYYYKLKSVSLIGKMDMTGSSPTDIFIGRYGYPYVRAGPLVPPQFGDTSILSTPERWANFPIEQIVDMRSRLVRGMQMLKVQDVEKGKMAESMRDLALAERPAEAELSFLKKPSASLILNDEADIFGASVVMKDFNVYNTKADMQIENKYFDDDATATTSLVELYDRGEPVSKLQRALSAGLFGLRGRRKFVPTRWSITAVDDTLSKNNLKEVKQNKPIDAIRAFYNEALDNRWLIFFIPGGWQYESMEAWYPHTIWNDGRAISIYSSYENYYGRKTYAEIGGCYYAARLAVSDKLNEMKGQAMVIILREVHPGYTMPVGVWNVREHVRQTLKETPVIIDSINGLFEYIKGKLEIPVKDWIRNSKMLKDLVMQKRLSM